VSSGPTQALCVDVNGALNLGGRHTEFPVDAIAQQIAASNLGADDVCVAISTSGTNGLTIRAAETAGEAGATVVGVTCFAHSHLARLADIAVVLGMHRVAGMADTAPVTGAALMLLLRALTTAVARRLDAAPEYQAHLHMLSQNLYRPSSPRGGRSRRA
jgi:DNA-binding MurR/RpiR family transcriptional regulator